MGSLEGVARRRRENFGIGGGAKMEIYSGKSPPQAENFGDFGPPKCRFTRGNRPKKVPILGIFLEGGPGNPPLGFTRFRLEGGVPGVK